MALVAVDGKLVTVEGKAIQLEGTVAGKDGVTFTPSVSDAGLLSWTNDGGKENPKSVNIKGPKGDPGADGAPGKDGGTGPQGPQGDPGADGAPGKDGTNGVTPTIGANGNWFTGTTDTGRPSRGAKGETGDTGPQGPQGPKGDPGADGKTPVKGTDYLTAADVAEIAQEAAGKIDLSGKLDNTGDGSSVTVSFTPPGATARRVNLVSGEKLSAALAKVYQWFANLGTLAFQSIVEKSDLASDVQASLGKADSALQSAPVTSVNGQTGAVQINIPAAVAPSNATPQAPAESGSPGSAVTYARGDHKHPKEIFWAVMGSTTYAEIKAAYDAGKLILGVNDDGNAKFQLVNARSNSFTFSILYTSLADIDVLIELFTVTSDGVWSSRDFLLEEDVDNLKTSLYKVTLSSSGWDGTTKQQTVTVSGILADRTKQEITVAPVDTSYNSAWNSCGVQCVAQAANSLTFQCGTVPTADIEVYVTVRNVTYQS